MLHKKLLFTLFLSCFVTTYLHSSEEKHKLLSFQEFEASCKKSKPTDQNTAFHYLGYLFRQGTIQDLETFSTQSPEIFKHGLLRLPDEYSIAESILHTIGEPTQIRQYDEKKTEFVKFFVNHGLNVNHVRQLDKSNLLVTSLFGQRSPELSLWLLQRNADPRLTTWQGAGPITATIQGHLDPADKLCMLQRIIDAGAQPQAEIDPMTGKTVLFAIVNQARYTNSKDFASRCLKVILPLMIPLIDAKAEMNETALHRAVQMEDAQSCAALIAYGANPSEKMQHWGYESDRSRTQKLLEASAFELAEKKQNKAILDILNYSPHNCSFIGYAMNEVTPEQRLIVLQKRILSRGSKPTQSTYGSTDKSVELPSSQDL